MSALYSILVQLTWLVLQLVGLFNPKIKLFVNGRKETFSILEKAQLANHETIWMHVASLGEYEQGLPVLQKLKEKYPHKKILLTFFSPSGYEVKKEKTPANTVVYLPMDSFSNVKRFLKLTKPELAIFIKYEVWPNYVSHVKAQDIPLLLVSGIFADRQIYFKWYGGFMKKALQSFSHYFVQETTSKKMLESIGLQNITVTGDTRLDRVSEILEQDNHLDFMQSFKSSAPVLVAGSTWPEDEEFIVDYINKTEYPLKTVFAPHNIKENHINRLKKGIRKKVICYTEIDTQNLEEYDVLIIDTIGILTKIYSYAQMAYVGGGFATGLHNTLEPAVFGIPVMIGPEYHQFNEAIALVQRGGLLALKDASEFPSVLNSLLSNPDKAQELGKRNSDYITTNKGATKTVIQHIDQLL